MITIDVAADPVVRLHNARNPDKLQHLGAVGDLTTLLSGGSAQP